MTLSAEDPNLNATMAVSELQAARGAALQAAAEGGATQMLLLPGRRSFSLSLSGECNLTHSGATQLDTSMPLKILCLCILTA